MRESGRLRFEKGGVPAPIEKRIGSVRQKSSDLGCGKSRTSISWTVRLFRESLRAVNVQHFREILFVSISRRLASYTQHACRSATALPSSSMAVIGGGDGVPKVCFAVAM
jgi:hypothetical protein